MLRSIKYVFFFLVLAFILSAVIKDVFIDTPQRSREKIALYLNDAAKNDIQANVFSTDKALIYKLYYGALIPMGEFRIKTEVDELGNQFVFEATTKGCFINRFIDAQASVTSFYSKNIKLPYGYVEKTNVNNKIKTKKIVFDQANLTSTRGDKIFRIPENTYDPVSAFIHMLTLSLTQPNEQKTKFVSGEDVYVLKNRVVKEKNAIAEIAIDMRRQDLSSSHGANFKVWVTVDTARVPLVFKCWSPIGYVSVILDSIEVNKKELK